MRIALALGLLAGIAATSGAGAYQNSPYDLWCRDQPVALSGTVQICMAYTLQQCLASRASPGESCYLNPRYAARTLR